MNTSSKTPKSTLVNSLAKRYDPKALQNQRTITAQKSSPINSVCKDSKPIVNIPTMDTKLDSLCQKIDNLLVEQESVVKKLENISQDIFGMEKNLETIKLDNAKVEKEEEKPKDNENISEMKDLFKEMINNLSSINKFAEQQAKRLDGVEQIMHGAQNFICLLMEEIRLSTIFNFDQKRPSTVKLPNVDNKMKKPKKETHQDKVKGKNKKCVKCQNSNKKSKEKLKSKKKFKVTKDQKANQKKALCLSFKGTKSQKKDPPDSERSVQRTQSCTQKEKVEKLNKENTEKIAIILVESNCPEDSDIKGISIDIPISRNRTPIEEDAPVASEEQVGHCSPLNEDIIQSPTAESKEKEGTKECLSKTEKYTGETELVISVREDDDSTPCEDVKQKETDDHENEDIQGEKENIDNEISEEEELLIQTEDESEQSEDEHHTSGTTDTSQDIPPQPKIIEDREKDTAYTDSSHSEKTAVELPKEENEESENLTQNGENGYHEHSCSSKRVADEDQVKDDNKKSKVDKQVMEEIISTKYDEETVLSLVISETPQGTDSKEDCIEQSPLKEEKSRIVLDATPPPPAPFDHRIVSAKHAQINSLYSVEKTEVLGCGRFGQVHRCVEKSSGLKLAAKIIKVRGHKEKEEVKNEIQVMNQLNHTNLIQLYDAFESRNDIVLVMEYVEGGELFDRIIDENSNLSEVDTILFIKQICEGIQYMHQMYIIHLDLKPENIMCVSRAANQIKIIDFGLARRYKPREKLKVHFGTPEFLAPEVVNYDFVSFPTDMWSVGVIAYMLLSGLSPFLGEDDNETLNNILACQCDFEGEEFKNISDNAKDFIIKLLIKEKCWRMSATESLKHSWLSDTHLHCRISQQTKKKCSLPEASVDQ